MPPPVKIAVCESSGEIRFSARDQRMESALPAMRLTAVVVGFPLIAWLFGSSVLRRFVELDEEERFTTSFGVTFAFLGAAKFVTFALNIPPTGANLGTAALLAAGIIACRPPWGKGRAQEADGAGKLAAGLALAYLSLVGACALLPLFRGSDWFYDWWMHFDEARIFLGQRPKETVWANGYDLGARTPLFDLATAAVMSWAGGDFAIYQLASALPSIVFLLPTYLLLRELFGRSAARLALLLGPLNLWMLHNAWFGWPKMLAVYFALLALYFYLRSLRLQGIHPEQAAQSFVMFGICGLLGFMTHQVVLVYVAPLGLLSLFMAWKQRTLPVGVSDVAVLVFTAVLMVGTWYGWLAGNLGVDPITKTPVTQGFEEKEFQPLNILWRMSANTAASIVPLDLCGFLMGGAWWLEPFYRALTKFYFSLLTGALTATLTLYFCFKFFRWLWGFGVWYVRRRRGRLTGGQPLSGLKTKGVAETASRTQWQAVWIFAGVGGFGAVFLHTGYIGHGVAHSAAFPTAILVTALAWGHVATLEPRTGGMLCAGMVAEFLIMFWTHVWFLHLAPEMLEELGGNEAYKDINLFFLNDWLGSGMIVFVIGAAAVQATLVWMLVRFWQEPERVTP